MEEGWRCFVVWHHATNALHTSTDKGHLNFSPQAASKEKKVLSAEEYLHQVDLATEAFRMFVRV